MPHGDLSDFAGLFSFATGLASIFAPNLWYREFGPVKPMFDGSITAESTAMISFIGSLLVFVGLASFIVRWNTTNAISAATGYFFAAINSAYIAHQMDGSFVLRGWHLFSAVFLIGAFHMKFNPNPKWTSKTLKAHEDEKAKKKKSS